MTPPLNPISRSVWGVCVAKWAIWRPGRCRRGLVGLSRSVTPLSHRVTPLSHRPVFRMAYLAMSSGETDVEIELSVLRTPRKHH